MGTPKECYELFEQILEASSYKTTGVWPLAPDHTNMLGSAGEVSKNL